MGKPKSPIVAIIGPTAVGKTAISLAVAPAIEGEVISVDSRQVYRYMDIGTDKVSMEDRRHVIHHLVDVADPDDTFTAARFVEEANGTIKRVIAREKRPCSLAERHFTTMPFLARCSRLRLQATLK